MAAAACLVLAGCGSSTPATRPANGPAPGSAIQSPQPQAFAVPEIPPDIQAMIDTVPGATELPSIDESSITHELHVDGQASEPGDGSARRPFATIAEAGTAARVLLRQGTPVRIRIRPGLYREQLGDLLRGGNENGTFRLTPVVIEGTSAGSVIISGAQIAPDGHDFSPRTWEPVMGHPGLYRHAWPYAWAPDPGPWAQNFGIVVPGVAQRQEAIFLDGAMLRQELLERYDWVDPDGRAGYTDGAGRGGDPDNRPGTLEWRGVVEGGLAVLARPGSFAVASDPRCPPDLRGWIFVRPPAGVDFANSTIEVPTPAAQRQPALLTVGKKENVVLRNLVLRHASIGTFGTDERGVVQHGALHSGALVLQHATNVLVEDCRFEHNLGAGVVVRNGRRIAFRRCASVWNHRNGFGLSGRELTVEDCDFSYNNLRGGWAGFIGWDPAGTKAGELHGATFRRVQAMGNWAGGLWFDVYCTNIRIERSLFYGNHRLGVQFELGRPDRGGYLLLDSVVAGNDVCGVFPGMVRDCMLIRNVITDNGFAGVLETEAVNAQIVVKNPGHKTAAYTPADWNRLMLHGNLIATRRPGSRILVELQRKASSEAYGHVLSVLRADANRYQAPDADAWRAPGGATLDFTAWKTLLAERSGGGEASSTWGGIVWSAHPEDEFTSASVVGTPTLMARSLGVPLDEAAIRDCQRQRQRLAASDTVDE